LRLGEEEKRFTLTSKFLPTTPLRTQHLLQ